MLRPIDETENPTDHGDRILNLLTAEVLFFGILNKLAMTQPDLDWIQALYKNEIFSESPLGMNNSQVLLGLSLVNSWFTQKGNGPDQDSIHELKLDHDHLFHASGGATSPFGSVYLSEEHLLFEVQTIQVRKWYAEYGLRVEQFQQIPDDHIGLELAFITQLAIKSIEVYDRGDGQKLVELLEAQQKFIKEQPLQWVDRWAQRVQENARTNFYKGVAQLIAGGIRSLYDDLAIISSKTVV